MPTQWSTSSRLCPVAAARAFDAVVARRECAVVVGAVDERVDDLAVGVDRAPAEDALLALELVGSCAETAPRARRLAPGRLDVVDGEGDVLDAVAVPRTCSAISPSGDSGAVNTKRMSFWTMTKLDRSRTPVSEPRVGHRREAPQGSVVVRGLLGVPDPELDVVDALEGQEVLRLGGRVRVDDRACLVGGAARERIGHGAESTAGPMPFRSAISGAPSTTSIMRSIARSAPRAGGTSPPWSRRRRARR